MGPLAAGGGDVQTALGDLHLVQARPWQNGRSDLNGDWHVDSGGHRFLD